jgi:hypothetical protein
MTSRGMEKMKNDTIGVDVSKDHLDAHRLADGATRREPHADPAAHPYDDRSATQAGGREAQAQAAAKNPRACADREPRGLILTCRRASRPSHTTMSGRGKV